MGGDTQRAADAPAELKMGGDMIKWADTQSFFQLTTALNLAYYSFGDMVVPSMRRVRADIDALKAHFRRAENHRGAPTEYTEVVSAAKSSYAEFVPAIEVAMAELETTHRYAAAPAIALAFVSFLCLSWGAFHASHGIPLWLLYVLYFVCVAPTLWYIGLNVYAKSTLDQSTLKKPLAVIEEARE